MRISRNKKRGKLAIIAIANREDVPEANVSFLVNEISKCVDRIVICCEVPFSRKDSFGKNVDVVYEHLYGYDSFKWKFAIRELAKGDYLNQFEEILCINDTFYGPVYPLSEMLFEMDGRQCDFWGMTCHGAINHGNGEMTKRFLQTYFIAFRASLFQSKAFLDFWGGVTGQNIDFAQYQREFEYRLTDYFTEQGYTYSVFADTRDWEAEDPVFTEPFTLTAPYRLIVEKKMPMIGKYGLMLPTPTRQSYETGVEIGKLFQYLSENKYFDVNLIYEDVLKKYNISDIMNRFELNYIFPQGDKLRVKYNRCAIVVYLFYEEMFRSNIEKLKTVPAQIDLIIFTTDETKRSAVEKCILEAKIRNHFVIQVVNAKGREWAALLIEGKEVLKDYDLFCFLHDKKAHANECFSVGRSFQDLLWENMISSKEYIDDVIQAFAESRTLGVLLPPIVMHSVYFTHYMDFWTICYPETMKLAEKLGINPGFLDRKIGPVSLGSVFWARKEALSKLLQFPFTREDFLEEPIPVDGTINHALERIVPFAAQQEGFYSAYVMNRQYAKLFYARNQEMITGLGRKIKNTNDPNQNLYLDYIKGENNEY